MAIGLCKEYAEIGVREIKINVRVRELGDGFVPPSDGFLLAEHARNTKIESVLNESALAGLLWSRWTTSRHRQ